MVTDFFSTINPKAKLKAEIEVVARLKEAAQDLWFVWDEPTDYDKYSSDMRKFEVKEMTGSVVDPRFSLVLHESPQEARFFEAIQEKPSRCHSTVAFRSS